MPNSQDFDFTGVEKVGIIGNGNVAMDVARVLGSSIERLQPTDIAEKAFEVLRKSKIREIDIYGRRGPVQAAMTVKELRYLSKVPGISLRVLQDEVDKGLSPASQNEAMLNSVQTNQRERARKRLFDLINSLPREHNPNAQVKINLRFMLAPVDFTAPYLTLAKTTLQGPELQQIAVPSEETFKDNCDLLIRSIGYSSVQIDKSLPFDQELGTVKNLGGKIEGNNYVTGWARTGPFGVIDTTMRNVFVIHI